MVVVLDTGDGDPSIARAHAAATIPSLDPAHSHQVARLALALFDALAAPLALPAEGRDLLAAAALWHDTGQRFGLDQHHRASYDVLMAERLVGFTDHDRQVIANLTRYHRGTHPSREHSGYRELPRRLRPLVDALAALLRIAEALDAGHLQVVRAFRCVDHGRYVTITVEAETWPMLETERARERAGLFRQVFGRDIEFVPQVRSDAAATGPSPGNGEETA
ncbi:MAG TPA: HD domain-containing protein [Thermomicrobiaceae bacterium]|nr:HD domain-containing protein [Thermomicrobiaceae bacterium]